MDVFDRWDHVPLEVHPDQSIAELQEALDLRETLIELLQFSDRSDSVKADGIRNYEEHKRTLEQWLASKAPPTQSRALANDPSANRALDLPSRDRGRSHHRREVDAASSPIQQSLSRKRARQPTLSDSQGLSHKARRLSDSSRTGSLADLSDSLDDDEEEQEFERERQRKRVLESQREREAYYAKIKADEELARLLQQQQAPVEEASPPHRGPSNEYMSQAQLGPDGGYRRRSMSPPASRSTSHYTFASASHETPRWSHASLAPSLSTQQTPSYGSSNDRVAAHSERSRQGPGDNDPRIQVGSLLNPSPSANVTPGHQPYSTMGMTTNQVQRYGNGIRPYQPGASNYSVPGSYPAEASNSDPIRTAPRPGQSMYGYQSSNSWQSRGAPDWMSQAVAQTASAFERGHTSFAGPSDRTYGGYFDLSDDESASSLAGGRSAFDLGYLGYTDPKQTKEDIEKLLANIRPDEELEDESRMETPHAMNVQLMKHQRLGLTWLKQQEEGSNKGSILADDMGLGKTIQAIGLIISRPSQDRSIKTTLIVCPVALMRQWERELNDKVRPGHKLKVFIYHGQKRATFAKLATYDVVITTIGKVGSELKRKDDLEVKIRKNPQYRETKNDELSILGKKCKFWRVIIDEAQCIKNHSTRGAKAAYQIRAVHRLCMTGTPMMNSVKELWSLIHFLKIQPYNEWNKFSVDINGPLSRATVGPARDRAMRCLQALLKALLLRRTKQSLIDGQPILKDLPARTTVIVHAAFDEEQESFYRALESRSQISANRYLKKGTTIKNYAMILVLLLRLRQACDHPNLIREYDTVEGSDLTSEAMEDLARQLTDDKVRMIKDANDAFECPICMDGTENPTIFFPCGHDVCAECFARLTDPTQAPVGDDEVFKARCPECRADVHPAKILSYNIFKKVHLPEKYMDGMLGSVEENAATSDDESSSSDEESDDDANSNGDLRDFIVNDDDVDEDEASNGEHEDGDMPSSTKPTKLVKGKGKAKQTKRRYNGKSKTADEVEEDDKAGPSRPDPLKKKKKKQTLAQLKRAGMRNNAARSKYIKRLRKDYRSSAKIEKTMELIEDILANDPSEKIIIFSQFTSFLDLLEIPMVDQHYGYRRYDGSMKPSERDEAVQDFYKHASIKVMLISLKAGNAGLNLTCASHVIILDPFWNPFIEEQAIDRAHRIGQTREVKVHRILVRGTVEDRIIDLQEKKRRLVNEALDEKASRDMGRLGVREFRYLFGLDNHLNDD